MPITLPPDFEQRKRKLFEMKGIDPSKFDIDLNTMSIVPRTAPVAGALETLGKTAAYNLPEAATSVAGAGLASRLVSAGLKAPHPLVKAGAIAAGALAAPTLVAKPLKEIKDIWYPSVGIEPKQIEQMALDRPIMSAVGEQLSALPFFRPANPLKSKLLENVFATSVGGAIPIASDVAQGQDINWGRAGAGALGNLLLSRPTTLGRKVGGLPSETTAAGTTTPTQPTQPEIPRELLQAVESLGIKQKFNTPEELDQFLAPVRQWLGESPRKQNMELKKLVNEYQSLLKQRDYSLPQDHPAIDQRLVEIEQEHDAIRLAQRISDESKMFRGEEVNYDMPESELARMEGEGGATEQKPVPPPENAPPADTELERMSGEGGEQPQGKYGFRYDLTAEDRAPMDPKVLEQFARETNPHEALSEAGAKAAADYAEDAKSFHSGFGALRNWFGNSKVRNEDGTPIRMYHATFQSSPTGGFEQVGSAHPSQGAFDVDAGQGELGTHFGPSNQSNDVVNTHNRYSLDKFAENARTIPVYLKIENPLRMPDIFPLGNRRLSADLQAVERDVTDPKAREIIKEHLSDLYSGLDVTPKELRRRLQALGYDGVVYSNNIEGGGEDSWIIFDPRQAKSALYNTGYDPQNPAIYHSGLPFPFQRRAPSKYGLQDEPEIRSRSGINPFKSEVEKLRSAGPEQARMADAWSRVFNTRREYQGRYANPMIGAVEKLSPEQQQKLYDTLIQEDRVGRAIPVAPELRAAYDIIRTTLRQMALDQQKSGQMVKLNNGYRTRGVDPHYMFNMIDRGVRRVLAEGQNTTQFKQLRKDFMQWQRSHGISQATAEARFNSLLGSLREVGGDNPFDFKGARTPEGVGLPDSWIERDPIVAIRKYVNAFTRDRAFYDVFEKNPELMAALGSTTYENAKPLPRGTKAINLSNDPQVQRVGRAYLGVDAPDVEPAIAGVGRLVNSLLLGGPVTKLTDIATVPFKALAYAPTGKEGDILRGIADWRKGYRDAFAQGFNRKGGLVVAQDILGIGEHAADVMSRIAEGVTKITGSEQLELISRGLSQAIGGFLGDSHRELAKLGNKESIAFLNRLGSDWQTISREELGTRIGQLLQGRYDITNLPTWAMQGRLAPFVTMMRWSIEQTNNFMQHVVEPARRGNLGPLAKTLIGGVGGGLLINEVREAISGKKAYTADWEELEEGKKQGDPGYKDALTYKLIAAAQVTGTAGVLMELMRQTYEEATGRLPQGFRYPVYEVGKDVLQRTSAAIKAMNEGEDPVAVSGQLTKDLLNRHVQIFRVVRNQLGSQGVNTEAAKDIKRSNQMRDQDVFTRMKNLPREAQVNAPPSYSRTTERKFDEASTLPEAAGFRSRLLERAQNRARQVPGPLQRSTLASEFRKLQTMDTRGMPSPDSQPERFQMYYAWLKATQGEEKAKQIVNEYMQQKALNEQKRRMIPTIK